MSRDHQHNASATPPASAAGAPLNEPPVLASFAYSPRQTTTPVAAGEGERATRSKVYGAPRIFDLFTLLAITLAFALLFAGMRLLSPVLADGTPTATISVSLFVTGIAIAQLALWNGKQPRLSSLVAGPILWWILLATLGWLHGVEPSIAIMAPLCSAPLGLACGYLGGAVVAGVFLVADALRYRHQTPVESRSQPKAPSFDEIE